MNKTILILFILIQNILSYGGDRPTEIYLSLSKNVSNSYESPIHKIPEIEVISNIENNKKISDIISISPSVIIKNNTSNYGLSLPSLRGFSSNQTVVVYDGVKLPKDITSTYDLSILPDNVFDKIYLLKGGWSSIFGANAEGGVVALKSIEPQENLIEFGSELSSFNTERYFIKTATVKDNISFLISAQNYESDGFQQNSQALKKSINAKMKYIFNESNELILNMFSVDLKRGLPSGTPIDISEFNGNKEKQANSLTDWQKDKNLFGSVKYNFKNENFGFEINYSRSDLNRAAYQFSSLTDINTYSNIFLSRFNLKNLDLGIEIEENKVKSKSYGNHQVKSIGYFTNKSFSLSEKAFCDLYLRYDDSKNFSNVFSPKSIFKYILNDNLSMTYSIGSSWRAPNFVDIYGAPLYWYNPNPNIKPEKSIANEFSFKYSGNVNGVLSFYYYSINDKISIFTDPNTFISKSVNMDKGYTKGVEISLSYAFKMFNLYGGINLIDVRGKNKMEGSYKKMAYSPDKKFSGGLTYSKSNTKLEFENIYVSKQWTSQNKQGKLIPSYFVSSLYISHKLKNLSIKIGIENIFNERYATTADSWNGYYPADPRKYSVAFSMVF